MAENKASGKPGFVPLPDYRARQKRLADAMSLRQPDRVPVTTIMQYFPTKLQGISNKDAQYRVEQRMEAWKEAVIEFDWDAAPPLSSLFPVQQGQTMCLQQIRCPNSTLHKNEAFPWVEVEYMLQSEYDEFLHAPSTFVKRKLWPRITKTVAPLNDLVQASSSLLPRSNTFEQSALVSCITGQPQVSVILEKFHELGCASKETSQLTNRYTAEMAELGYPTLIGAITSPTFDWVADTLRGSRGLLQDIHQVPDKLLAALDMCTPIIIRHVIGLIRQVNIPCAFIPLRRGSDSFISEEQFARFYWPGLKSLLIGLIDAGITPVPFLNGDYTTRLKFLQELPPGKVTGHFDRINRKVAKRMVGKSMCFWGNIAAQLMITGKPQQVEDDVKQLIDIFSDNGGLILDSAVGMPDESKPENVWALTEAVHKYGMFC